MFRGLVVLCSVGLVPAVAWADVFPENAKSVKHTAMVQVDLPPGKAIVVENTWSMPTLVSPGRPTHLWWKGFEGPMRLRLVDVADAPPPRPEDGTRPDLFVTPEVAAKTVAAAKIGLPCSEPFTGNSIIADWSKATEYRHTFVVTLAGEVCSSSHQEGWLDDAGQPLEPSPAEVTLLDDGWGAYAPAPGLPAIPAPVHPPAPEVATPPPNPAPSGCGCRSEPGGGWWGLLAGVGVVAMRPRRRTG